MLVVHGAPRHPAMGLPMRGTHQAVPPRRAQEFADRLARRDAKAAQEVDAQGDVDAAD